MRRTAFLSLALAPTFACSVGPKVSSFAPAQRPAGASVRLHLKKQTVGGELLAAGDTALVLLRGAVLVLVPYTAIKKVELPEFELEYGTDGAAPDAATLEVLRRRSRFSRGIAPELLTRLLVAYHQDALAVLP
ncbi:MAG TPA: hypothetical protein VM736_06880 [Gemmatimonadales bacterium]|nr:hypothetical protein [Gemmatimonadales bacterium]